jgi:hypothetical protein
MVSEVSPAVYPNNTAKENIVDGCHDDLILGFFFLSF